MKISTSEEDIDKLLEIIDPYNNKKVTFSDCLSLLSSVYLYEYYRKLWH